jgi:hypothetical protein
MRLIYQYFCGRHSFYALFFTVSMTVLAAFGRLSGEAYVAGMGVVQTLIAFHSAQENYFEKRCAQ